VSIMRKGRDNESGAVVRWDLPPEEPSATDALSLRSSPWVGVFLGLNCCQVLDQHEHPDQVPHKSTSPRPTFQASKLPPPGFQR
jgi:hypothetical protein